MPRFLYADIRQLWSRTGLPASRAPDHRPLQRSLKLLRLWGFCSSEIYLILEHKEKSEGLLVSPPCGRGRVWQTWIVVCAVCLGSLLFWSSAIPSESPVRWPLVRCSVFASSVAWLALWQSDLRNKSSVPILKRFMEVFHIKAYEGGNPEFPIAKTIDLFHQMRRGKKFCFINLV